MARKLERVAPAAAATLALRVQVQKLDSGLRRIKEDDLAVDIQLCRSGLADTPPNQRQGRRQDQQADWTGARPVLDQCRQEGEGEDTQYGEERLHQHIVLESTFSAGERQLAISEDEASNQRCRKYG